MGKYILAILLCGIFFLFPFQIYLIGNGIGIGIEGAVYRLQITSYGNSFLPITSDIMYIVKGIISGKTALSIVIWFLGTVLLTVTTIFGLIYSVQAMQDYYKQVSFGLTGACIFYIISCIVQYGFLLNGPAGRSIPIGIFLLLFWVILLNRYPELLSSLDKITFSL